METRASEAVAVVIQASQAALGRKLGTSHAKARSKAEAGRSHNKTAKKAPVSRARVVPVSLDRIRVADSLGTATFVARWAIGQQTALRKGD